MPFCESAFRRSIIAALLLAWTCGCSNIRPLTRDEIMKGSLVFMYIETSDMSGHLDWVSLKQVKAGEAPSFWSLGVVKESYIYFDGLPSGSYQMDSYGGAGGIKVGCLRLCSNTSYSYNFSAQGGGIRIPKKGVYFLGSYVHKKAGTFFDEKFEIRPVKRPTEKEVLERLIPELKDSPLLPMAQSHLRSLQ